MIVQPATVVSWHRRRFRRYWWKLSRNNGPGRPHVAAEARKLVRTMAAANVTWGAPRIHGELLKLGFEISERTVSRLMPKERKKPSQTWKSFLTNHIGQLVSIDFFTISTVQLRVLFVFVVLARERRRLVHFNVTEHPTAEWRAQGMSRPYHRAWRAALEVDFKKIHPILPRFSKSSILGKGFTKSPAGPIRWTNCCDSSSRWPASSLRTSLRLNRKSEHAKHRPEALMRFLEMTDGVRTRAGNQFSNRDRLVSVNRRHGAIAV